MRPPQRQIRATPTNPLHQQQHHQHAQSLLQQQQPRDQRPSPTPEPRARTVAPNREDKNYQDIENLCPPLNSLPDNPYCLRVEWKGNPLDLSKDPHAHLLHPAELLLASTLRLDCATYLTSKRRLFVMRFKLLLRKPEKEFRKTDAQQACKIDVNKASKLWTAYERVGWLDRRWMEPHLLEREN